MAKVKAEPGSKDVKASKQSTLMGFFTKPKPLSSAASGPSSSSPASTTLKTPSSAMGSSPVPPKGSKGVRQGSPLKQSITLPADDDDEEELSPPPTEDATPMELEEPAEIVHMPSSSTAALVDDGEGMEVDEAAGEDSPLFLGRRAKRKVVYVESDEESVEEAPKAKPNGKAAARKPRKSLRTDDDDEFNFSDGDDAALAAMAEEYEASIASPSPSVASSASPAPRRAPAKGFKQPKAVPKKPTTAWPSAGGSSKAAGRPGPRPIAGGERSSGWSDDRLLTKSERDKISNKEASRAKEEVYSFLKDVRDADGRRPDDPEYDKRTIKIPNSAWNDFTPFERQFWNIKKDHYDTVLFFQKGKFYELYEDDALIGHQEFDLKLTDRVKMKMVGVPEQSFEYWAAKFLAAGHKVGKVEQVETAIGSEMRKRNEPAKKGKAADPSEVPDKIVRRELAQVFTNGTIVDSTYLTSDEANHCVAIKEYHEEGSPLSSFGICTMDASTGEFNLTAFEDDVVRTRLETMFRQIRPKEIIHAKGNLSVATTRLLRNILPSNTLWQSFKPEKEFCSADETLSQLGELFETEDDEPGSKPQLPEAINEMLGKPIAMEALGGMLFYLKSLNLDKDLMSQRNFNVYDPIKEGRSLVLDGQTLGHMEVLVNNEGGNDGTLLQLLSQCSTPFGKRLFRIWLTAPLRDIASINERLDAIDDLMAHPDFMGEFTDFARSLPDLERLISRIHAGRLKESEFLKVMSSFDDVQSKINSFSNRVSTFGSQSIAGLLRSAPDMLENLKKLKGMYKTESTEKTVVIMPKRGADAECDEADAEVEQIEGQLEEILRQARKTIGTQSLEWWHSAQGGKEIYQINVPAKYIDKVPNSWTKQSGTKNMSRYYPAPIIPVVRALQEARETQNATKKNFFKTLLAEFDRERNEWLSTIRVIAELDCLVSLARASASLDEPKCRPQFVESNEAFIEFTELRHPAMCLRSDNFIPNNVSLGGSQPRQVLLTGPNMAGKSTLLRMTAAGIIMAQMGCYVPAASAKLAPVDKIQTRMGAYDNMFASASTFKVELDECSKILREAGPRSFVILDELGRGTSTYDGMAIAGAVLHHLATHTLPLGFFATHYGSLTDDFAYHPNIRRMHMQTHVDDEERRVVFLYKLIPGVAESSHGTHVANMAGVPLEVVSRAEQVSQEFFEAFKIKLVSRRRSKLPLVAQADFTWLLKLAMGTLRGGNNMEVEGEDGNGVGDVGRQMEIIRRAVATYEA